MKEKEVNEKVFFAMKQMAKVFSQEHAENRVQLHALVAMDHIDDPEYWPVYFPYEINADIASMNGIAHINWDWEKEVLDAVDVFFIKYFDCDLYHSGEAKDCFTDPMDDLGMTLDQLNVIKDIVRDGMFYTIEDHPCNNEEIVDELVGWIQDNHLNEKRLMNDVNDILE